MDSSTEHGAHCMLIAQVLPFSKVVFPAKPKKLKASS